MATVQQIIEAAYARSTSNDPGKLAVDGEMIAVLNRVFQMLFAAAAHSQPSTYESFLLSAAISAANSTMPLPGFTLPTDMIDLRRVEGVGGGSNAVASGVKIPVIPIEDKDRTFHFAPAMIRLGNFLMSRNSSGDPIVTEKVNLYYLDAPAALTAIGNTIDARFPVRHHELLVLALAVYLSAKDTGRDPNEWSKLLEERNTMLEIFLKQAGTSMTAMATPFGGEIKQRLDSLYVGQQAPK